MRAHNYLLFQRLVILATGLRAVLLFVIRCDGCHNDWGKATTPILKQTARSLSGREPGMSDPEPIPGTPFT